MNAHALLQPEAAAQPCRNFCILGKTSLRDPLDGRIKLVLANFAAHATGNIILIDVETGAGESIILPGDSGAWALYNWNDEKLIVGTCPGFGYVHSLDLRTRKWAEPLRDENETYIWNFTLGSDGRLYGGTYPGCVLLRYDPEQHTLRNMGRMSDNPKNMYTRYVGSVPGHIIVSGGLEDSFVLAWNIASGEQNVFAKPGGFAHLKEVNERYIKYELGDETSYYDSTTLQLIDASSIEKKGDGLIEVQLGASLRAGAIPLGNGRNGGVRGQDYFITDGSEERPVLKSIPTVAPATHIYGLTADRKGRIWGSSGFGQTIFRYDPSDGSCWNSSVVCNSGGEVYMLQEVDDRLFMTAYSGGDHIVYDPDEPWDQIGNVNPRTLDSVGPDWIRPLGHSIIGPDRAIWTGWSANYGVYGGGITRLDTKTLEVSKWPNPFADQQVASLASDDRYIVFVTSRGGNGLPAQEEPCHFGVMTTEGEVIYHEELPAEAKPGKVVAAGGRIYLAQDDTLRVFDTAALRFTSTIALGRRATGFCAAGGHKLLVFCPNELLVLDTETGAFQVRAELPGTVDKAVITPDQTLYFGVGTQLYSLPMAQGGLYES